MTVGAEAVRAPQGAARAAPPRAAALSVDAPAPHSAVTDRPTVVEVAAGAAALLVTGEAVWNYWEVRASLRIAENVLYCSSVQSGR